MYAGRLRRWMFKVGQEEVEQSGISGVQALSLGYCVKCVRSIRAVKEVKQSGICGVSAVVDVYVLMVWLSMQVVLVFNGLRVCGSGRGVEWVRQSGILGVLEYVLMVWLSVQVMIWVVWVKWLRRSGWSKRSKRVAFWCGLMCWMYGCY